MSTTITAAEAAADREAERAAEELRKFREANWAYFYSTEQVLPNGVVVPRARNEPLERESFRLFDVARSANKRALDLEHANRRAGVAP